MAAEWRDFLEPLGPGRMRISKHGSMLTDAILIADEQHMAEHSDDRSPPSLSTLPAYRESSARPGRWPTGTSATASR